jgi:hypothetical protein
MQFVIKKQVSNYLRDSRKLLRPERVISQNGKVTRTRSTAPGEKDKVVNVRSDCGGHFGAVHLGNFAEFYKNEGTIEFVAEWRENWNRFLGDATCTMLHIRKQGADALNAPVVQ